MVACYREWRWDGCEHSGIVMDYRGKFPVHRFRSANDASAKSLTDGLVPQANPKKRNTVFGGGFYQIKTNASVLGVARARGDDDVFRLRFQNVGYSRFVVTKHDAFSTKIAYILN